MVVGRRFSEKKKRRRNKERKKERGIQHANVQSTFCTCDWFRFLWCSASSVELLRLWLVLASRYSFFFLSLCLSKFSAKSQCEEVRMNIRLSACSTMASFFGGAPWLSCIAPEAWKDMTVTLYWTYYVENQAVVLTELVGLLLNFNQRMICTP